MSDDSILSVAREDHKAGRLEVAELLYRQVLEAEPEHPEATHLLGVVELQRDDVKRAVILLERATRLNPDSAQVQNHYGIALKAAERLDDAELAFEASIALDRDFAEAHYNRGTVLQTRGASQAASEAFRETLAREPDHTDAQLNLGVALRSLGHRDEAIVELQRALELRPGWTVAQYNLAVLLRESGRLGESLTATRAVLGVEPRLGAAWLNLGETHRALGDQHAAADAYERASQAPQAPHEAFYNLALMRLRLGEHHAATEAIRRYLTRLSTSTRGLTLQAAIAGESGDDAIWRQLMDFERLIRPVRIDGAPGWPGLGHFNHALCEHVTGHPSLSADPAGHATRHGEHSGNLLVEPKGPIAALEDVIQRAIRDYIDALGGDSSHPFLVGPPQQLELAVWAVVLGAGGHQVPHTHPSAWLSGVYYARVPECIIDDRDDGRAGWIEFGRPHPDFGCHMQPQVHAVKPEEGLLLLFPAYFHHSTVPFQCEGTRISIAFDASRSSDLPGRTEMRAAGY